MSRSSSHLTTSTSSSAAAAASLLSSTASITSSSKRRIKPLSNKQPLLIHVGWLDQAVDYILEQHDELGVADSSAAGGAGGSGVGAEAGSSAAGGIGHDGDGAGGSGNHSGNGGHGVLSSLGVDKAESSEHHLQAALSNHGLRHQRVSALASSSSGAGSSSSSAANSYHIPTPDASRVVDDAAYARYYPLGTGPGQKQRWKEPSRYIKSSATIEETSGGLGGLGFDANDDDLEWLKKYNATLSSSTTNGHGSGSNHDAAETSSNRSNRKSNNHGSAASFSLKLDETVFEYIMGMFEIWTERNVPMLHTNFAGLLPAFSSMESLFSDPGPPASYYPSYESPPPGSLPPPAVLTKMAKDVWPHWKKRKEQRQGRSIIPQLNSDEANESDPYVCFRRRDLKNQRKTRNKDTTSADRMQKVQGEMLFAHALVALILEREQQKRKQQLTEKEIWDRKWRLLELKRKHAHLTITPEEEALLFTGGRGQLAAATAAAVAGDKSQPLAKKPRLSDAVKVEKEDPRATPALATPRGSISGPVPAIASNPGTAQASAGVTTPSALPRSRAQSPVPVERTIPPEQLAVSHAERVEKELRRKKEMDRHWEDSADLGSQTLPVPAPIKHFRCIPAPREPGSPGASSSSSHARRQICFRLRRGRGGIIRLDRKFPSRHSASLPDGLARYFRDGRPAASDDDEDDDADDDAFTVGTPEEEDFGEERRRLSERWRYDADLGRIGFGMGDADDDQVVIDDFETRYIKMRTTLVTQADLDLLKPSVSALQKVHAALDAKPDPPPAITFQRTVPTQMPIPPQLPPGGPGHPSQQSQPMMPGQPGGGPMMPGRPGQPPIDVQVQNIARQAQLLQAQAAAQSQGQMGSQIGQPPNPGPPMTSQQQQQQAQQQQQIRRMMANQAGGPGQRMPQMNMANNPGGPRPGGAPMNPSPQFLAQLAAAQRQAQANQQQQAGVPNGVASMPQAPLQMPPNAPLDVQALVALANRTPASMQSQLPAGYSPSTGQAPLPQGNPAGSPSTANMGIPGSPLAGLAGLNGLSGLNAVTAQQLLAANPKLREHLLQMSGKLPPQGQQLGSPKPGGMNGKPPTPQMPDGAGPSSNGALSSPINVPGGHAMRTGNNGSPHPSKQSASPAQRQVQVG